VSASVPRRRVGHRYLAMSLATASLSPRLHHGVAAFFAVVPSVGLSVAFRKVPFSVAAFVALDAYFAAAVPWPVDEISRLDHHCGVGVVVGASAGTLASALG